jgi:8-amino-7-oxononanoate synthase
MPIADALAKAELSKLSAQGLTRTLEPLDGPQGPLVHIGGVPLVNFSSNDYLGLASHPALADAARGALDAGAGAGSSRLVVGSLRAHHDLEAALAAFEGAEATLLYNSGYAANLGAVVSLVGRGDAIFSDALNHASLVDGAHLSRAEVQVYRHLDLGHLADLLRASSGQRKLILSDTVFSMDGDLAPLPELVALAESHGAMVVADEAHATGVFGATGAGRAQEAGLAGRIDVRVGTLSKAVGSFGAFAAGSRPVCDLLLQKSRALIFTTALPPAVCAASQAGLQVMAREPERRARLWEHIRYFATGLRSLGVPAEPRSPIFPVVVGTAAGATQLSARLRQLGILAKAIRPPTVPEGTSRLRFSLSAAHESAHLDAALEALRRSL